MKLLIVFLVVFIAAVVGFEHDEIVSDASPQKVKEPRIIGGKFASVGQFPWQAAIYTYGENDTQKMFCGGAVIDNQWVLTAAQCTKDALKYVIYLGATNIERETENGRQVVNSTSVFVHKSYNETTLKNDIALIKLDNAIIFDRSIKKIAIAHPSDYIGSEVQVIVSGWGKTSDAATANSTNILNFVNLTTIANNDCEAFYGKEIITKNILCTSGTLDKNICTGDNGGPLIVTDSRNQVVHAGIISYVKENNCSSTLPARYVRTANYHEWIKNRTDSSGSNSINVSIFYIVFMMLFKQILY